jgi:hypothetical protein
METLLNLSTWGPMYVDRIACPCTILQSAVVRRGDMASCLALLLPPMNSLGNDVALCSEFCFRGAANLLANGQRYSPKADSRCEINNERVTTECALTTLLWF